ncbi:zinc finger protein 836-like isoform X2 [Prorops nasuta]|uniref:zinc finger protein 836-like isoform X2 n=1 Tax=Prorops nasuta TaxID=863751 RepID=UPI0034CE3411
MSSLDYLDLCRLCLVKDCVSTPIFGGEGDVRQIFLKIAACLPVKVAKEDKLPKKICNDCVYKVELCYDFWNTTANSEKQLLQWLGGSASETKQNYASDGRSSQSVLKSEGSSGNRLGGPAINNMGIGIMDNIGLGVPMMISSNNQQQISSVPMDTSSNSVQTSQAVPGPSSQTARENAANPTTQDEEEISTEDEENSDDDNDAEGLPVKEESEEDANSSRNIEPTTFVNVSLACDEAGPSGLQRQKIAEIPEMTIPQTVEGDPKSGYENEAYKPRGIFIYDKESVLMRKWQILEFDGKPYYAFVPEDDEPMALEDIPEEIENMGEEKLNTVAKMEYLCGDNFHYDSADQKLYGDDYLFNDSNDLKEDSVETEDIKPIILNGTNEAGGKSSGDLYEVNVDGSMVTLQRLTTDTMSESEQKIDESQQEDIEEDDEGDIEYLDEDLLSPKYFKDSGSVTNQAGSESTKGSALKCKACSETFSSPTSFRKHVAWTHKKKMCIQEKGQYICAVCDYKTLKKSQFAAHLERKHETWSRKRVKSVVYPCNACGFECRSKHSLQSHFIRKHTDKYEHQCKFCTKKFKVKGDLTNHIRFHHKEKPLNCDVCGKVCQNSGSLYVHQKWAHYKPKYECHICKRRMVTQENLDQHLLMQHEKREKIVCAECGKTFTKKDSFKRHLAVHTGSKPHSCLICSKPFARRSQLRQHLLIHTGKRPFVCDICGKAFTQKPGLICHRKTHPGTHPPLPVMPIADIVKKFTDGYIQEINAKEREERIDEDDASNEFL